MITFSAGYEQYLYVLSAETHFYPGNMAWHLIGKCNESTLGASLAHANNIVKVASAL